MNDIKRLKVRSFTLLEVLLVIAIITIIAGFSLPVYQLLTIKNDLDVTASSITQSLRRAQLFSRGVVGDSNWGVKIQMGNLTLYKGPSFSSRDTSSDELTSLPPEVNVSGLDEINFTKLYGATQNNGIISLSVPRLNDINIFVNEKGTVDQQT